MNNSLKNTDRVKWMVVTALFLAFNIIMASIGIPVPGGHLYLCDAIICTAALLLDPLGAFIVGGVGSFLGDLLFYPAPMFVSLVTHGLQAVVISVIAHRVQDSSTKKHFAFSLVATLIGGVIMVVGYTLGKIYVYSTFEYAMIKLPYEIAQAAIGVVSSLFLYYKAGLGNIFKRNVLNAENN
ncbi:MAG: ECF transporter S component [Lachnospiraceae bacterium]|nr:ECF transporter S component [Lachnospiraceae bacterium]